MTNTNYAIEWHYEHFDGSPQRANVTMKSTPHPADWGMQDRDYDEIERFMRGRTAEFDRLVDELEDVDDYWWGTGKHANPKDRGNVIKTQICARDDGYFSIALVTGKEDDSSTHSDFQSLVSVVPAWLLPNLSIMTLRAALRSIDEPARKRICRRVIGEQELFEQWVHSPTRTCRPPVSLAFSVPMPFSSAPPLDSAFHDFERLVVRSLLPWMENNAEDSQAA
jgi:hypothetical protein